MGATFDADFHIVKWGPTGLWLENQGQRVFVSWPISEEKLNTAWQELYSEVSNRHRDEQLN